MLNLFFWRSDASKHLKKLSALLIFLRMGILCFWAEVWGYCCGTY